MPTIQIQDGGGSGRVAKVTTLQQVETFSQSVSAEHYANHRLGQAFTDRLRQTAGGNDVCLAYMENTGTKTFILEGVTQSVDGACELYIELNNSGTRNAATDNVPINLNTGSGITMDMTMEHGTDLAGGAATLTTGDEVERAIFRAATSSAHYNFPCDIVVQPGGTVTLWCDTSGVEIVSTLFLYVTET